MPAPIARNSYFDIMRILSILGVIVIHSIATMVLQSPVGSKSWLVGNAIDSFMRWTVPVFVMISGALLIRDKTFNNRKQFLKHKLTRILVPLIVWPIIYVSWDYIFSKVTPNSGSIINGYVSGSPAPGHLYFLFLIAGLYLIAPVISLYAMYVKRRQFIAATLFVLLLTAVWHLITSLVPGQESGQQLNAITQGLPYIGLFMLGYVLNDVKPKTAWAPPLVFLASGCAISLTSYYMTLKYGLGKGLTFYAFMSIPATVMAASAYLTGEIFYQKTKQYFSGKVAETLKDTLRVLSEATFGVYLAHLIIMSVIIRSFSINLMSFKQVLLTFVLTAVFSYIVSLTLIRIPYVRVLVK